jgi:hypothetical protein
VNTADTFRLRFQSLVARGLAASGIADRVGLRGASEVWGGDRPRERPAWYVWLRDHSGAWQIELAGAGTPEVAGLVVARFTIRHYPDPNHAVFALFSAEERGTALATLDSTGTPRIDVASTIPEAFFTVGTLDWWIDVETDAAAFVFASLDRLQTRTSDGALVRDVPGWSLSVPVFSLAAGLLAQVERRFPTRLVVSRQPGFEVSGSHSDRDHATAAYGEALLAFPQPGGGVEATARLVEALRDSDAEIVGEALFEAGRHPPHVSPRRFQVARSASRGVSGSVISMPGACSSIPCTSPSSFGKATWNGASDETK